MASQPHHKISYPAIILFLHNRCEGLGNPRQSSYVPSEIENLGCRYLRFLESIDRTHLLVNCEHGVRNENW
jgi:hypothetical protein